MVWRESSAPADSPWWLEKHYGGYYTLLFYPSAVSACSLSLHTIKTTSLAQAHRAWHRKWSLVEYPHCDPVLLILMNESVLFCTSKEVFCLHWRLLSVYPLQWQQERLLIRLAGHDNISAPDMELFVVLNLDDPLLLNSALLFLSLRHQSGLWLPGGL